MSIITTRRAALGAVLAAAAVTVPVLPASAGAATTTRAYEGTVVSVNRAAHTFRLRDAERGTIRIRVTNATTFQHVTFAGLRRGVSSIEATVRRSGGRWVAVRVERSAGGGNHGGGDDTGGNDDHGGGHDDGPNHG